MRKEFPTEATPSQPTRPPWLKVRLREGEEFRHVESILQKLRLNTVCREAACPNIGECFNQRTATFLILGNTCTRTCGFCNVKHGNPGAPDLSEAERVARAVKEIGLDHVVVTSVTRDDLADGGSRAYATTVEAIKSIAPATSIQVLIPDFKGSKDLLRIVLNASPDVLGHNLETVPRLYQKVRPQADYGRSLTVLRSAKQFSSVVTKCGIMVGLGETKDEILQVLNDLGAVECDIVTIGQYLAPNRRNLLIKKYYTPQEFAELSQEGSRRGIRWVESGPLVRSSFHAGRQWKSFLSDACGL